MFATIYSVNYIEVPQEILWKQHIFESWLIPWIKKNGEACKNFFMRMVGISSEAFSTARKEILQTLLTQMIEVNISIVVHTLNEDMRHDIKQHILSLPTTRMHWCRVRIPKICSGGSPNTASVCTMYRNWYTWNGKNQEEQNVGKVYLTLSSTSAFSNERKT